MANEQERFLKEIQNQLSSALENKELDDGYLESATDRLSLDKSLWDHQESLAVIAQLAVRLLNVGKDYNLEAVLSLLDVLLKALPFETIISLFPVEAIATALQSPVPQVQSLGLKVVGKAQPVDIIANTELIPLCVELFANEGSTVGVVNDFEKSMTVLVTGELVRRRLLSSQVLGTLRRMLASVSLRMRLNDLLLKLFQYVKPGDIPDDLYQFDKWLDDDFWIVSTIDFYTSLLELGKNWIVDDISQSIVSLSKEFCSHEQSTAHYTLNGLLGALSRTSMELTKQVDDESVHISIEDTDLLIMLSPEYIYEYRKDIIKSLGPLSDQNAAIYISLMGSEGAFKLAEPQFHSGYLSRSDYLSFLIFALGLTSHSYTKAYLLTGAPSIMNRILEPGNRIIEPDSYELRSRCLSNLIQDDRELGVWKQKVFAVWRSITQGQSFRPGVEIMDTSL